MTSTLQRHPLQQQMANCQTFLFPGTALPVQAQVGGKALGLLQMAAAGLPVPPGLCLTADWYQLYLHETGLASKIAEQRLQPVFDWRQVQQWILQTPLPVPLEQELRQAISKVSLDNVAVRSSGLDEDGSAQSFAGQHDTFLCVAGIDAVLQAVRSCWASLWSPRAVQYRQYQQMDVAATSGMGVVIQQMIQGEVSGVAFGSSPVNGQSDAFLIEACFGLGEGLVSGRVSSDAYTVSKSEALVLEQQIRLKTTGLYWQQQIREVILPLKQRKLACMTEELLLSLRNLLLQNEAYFQQIQDVEWTWQQGRFYLLQSRPVTGQASAQPPVEPFYQGDLPTEQAAQILWSRMDIGEIFTGAMSPLGVSFARYYQHKVHQACGRGLGLLDLGKPHDYMAYHQGHVYLNVSYTAYLLSQTPAGADQLPFLQRFACEGIDLTHYRNPYGERHQHPDYPVGACRRFWLKKNVQELLSARRRAKTMVASRYREFERARQLDLTSMDLNALREEMLHALDYFKAMHIGYLPYYINAFGCYGQIVQWSEAWLGHDGKTLQQVLKGDMSSLRTIQAARDVWQLCQALQQYPMLCQVVKTESLELIKSTLHSTAEGLAFQTDYLLPFMHENGVRAQEEMELTHPRWVDEPDYVLQMMKTYLRQGVGIEDKLTANQQNKATQQKLLQQLSWGKRRQLGLMIRLYTGCSKLREETRMSMITSIWLVRRLVYEVGRRLLDSGHLQHWDEVGCLDFADVLYFINGYASADALFPRQKTARAMQAWVQQQCLPEPALSFFGNPPPTQAPKIAANTAQLNGLATSAGVVTAKARVITCLTSQAHEFIKGEIIVAPFTDASWTPLFALASGVVSDLGSMLSHSSIVAREFGLPAVVNTHVATKRIRTGDLIQVDGMQGTVTIVAEEEE